VQSLQCFLLFGIAFKKKKILSLQGDLELLGLCGFEKIKGGEFLFLSREKVNIQMLHMAGNELNNTIKNPFLGVHRN
jgi:UBX domain-containing protein 1/4